MINIPNSRIEQIGQGCAIQNVVYRLIGFKANRESTRLLILVMIFTGFNSRVLAQFPKDTSIVLNFIKNVGTYPQQKRWFISEHLSVNDTVSGVPASLKDYRLYRLDFNYNHTLYLKRESGDSLTDREDRMVKALDSTLLTDIRYDHYMYAVCGLRRGKKIVIFDSDRNGDFRGERIFEFDYEPQLYIKGDSTPYDFEVDLLTKVDRELGNHVLLTFDIFDGSKVRPFSMIFEVQPYYDIVPNPDFPGSQDWYDYHFILLKSEFVQANVRMEDSLYQIFIIPNGTYGYKSTPVYFRNVSNGSSVASLGKDYVKIAKQFFKLDIGCDGWKGILTPASTLPSKKNTTINIKNYKFELLEIDSGNVFSNLISGADYCLLHFFGTWCGACKVDFPELSSIAKAFNTNGDFRITGIANEVQINYSKLRNLRSSYDLTWDILVDRYEFGNSRSLAYQLGVSAYPEYLLFDQNGDLLLSTNSLKSLKDFLVTKEILSE